MFDWDAETWERAAQRALDLVNRVSTGWSDRRPGPAAGPDEILSAFKEPLPRTPSSFEEIAERLAPGHAIATVRDRDLQPPWCRRSAMAPERVMERRQAPTLIAIPNASWNQPIVIATPRGRDT